MADPINFGTPTWASQPGMNDPGFDQFMQGITQDYSNYGGAQGFTNTPVSSLYQELGEGNQGQQLLKDYQGGLTGQQVHNAYYGQYGNINPSDVTALGDTDPSKLTGNMADLYSKGLLQYVPAVAGDPGQTADNPAHYELAAPVTHTGSPGAAGNDPTIAQPLFNHGSQTGLNDGAFSFDPTKGFVTSPTNVHGTGGSISGAMDKYVPMATDAALAAIGGAAAAPLLGSVGSGLAKMAIGGLTSGQGFQFNPMQLISMIGGQFGVPPSVLQAIQMGGGLLNGGKINPTQIAMGQIPNLTKTLMGNFNGG